MLFDESAKSYRAGRFEEAVRLLREAYALKANPVLLYNMARAYEGMGALPEAVDAYTRYLRDESNVHDRGAIEKRLETLRKQIEERDALARRRQELEAEHARPEPKPEPPRSTSASPIPWIVAGVGVAGLGTGIVFGLMSSSRHDAAVSEPQQDVAAREQDTARTYAVASTVAFIAGSVLTAGGVAWGILDVRAAHRAREASSARIVFGPGWAGVRGSF